MNDWLCHLTLATFLNLWVWSTVIGWMLEIEPKAEPLNLHPAPPEPPA